MTAISTSNPDIKRLADLPKEAFRNLTTEEIADQKDIFAMPFRVPVGKADNHPDNIYATVKVNGKIVATLYNSGGSWTPNGVTTDSLSSFGANETGTGPRLAQKRAEELAKLLGGTIEKASTALDSGQWKPRPVQWTYDFKAIEAARSAYEAHNHTVAANVLAQLIAQNGGVSVVATGN